MREREKVIIDDDVHYVDQRHTIYTLTYLPPAPMPSCTHTPPKNSSFSTPSSALMNEMIRGELADGPLLRNMCVHIKTCIIARLLFHIHVNVELANEIEDLY
jgi:hypothetical protein